MDISYIELSINEFDLIKPLWEKLKNHHRELSTHFSGKYNEVKFNERKEEILKKSDMVKIDIVKDNSTGKYIGYCISSINNDTGEIDSIYLEENYRVLGIGRHLISKALDWMNENKVKNKKIVIAVGNEELLAFYKKFDFLPRHIILDQKQSG